MWIVVIDIVYVIHYTYACTPCVLLYNIQYTLYIDFDREQIKGINKNLFFPLTLYSI